mgnify:FL=1
MYEMLALLSMIGLAVIPWFVWPVHRVLYTENVGYMYERLILGFFFPVSNLSNRKNYLERKQRKLQAELKKLGKELDDENKHLTNKVKLVDQDYRNHLVDHGGTRDWRYWFRKVGIPSIKVIKQVEGERKELKRKRTVTYFTLEEAPLPPGFRLDKDAGRLTKDFIFHDNSRNQQQNQNQQKKKGNNQQQQNNQQNQGG